MASRLQDSSGQNENISEELSKDSLLKQIIFIRPQGKETSVGPRRKWNRPYLSPSNTGGEGAENKKIILLS